MSSAAHVHESTDRAGGRSSVPFFSRLITKVIIALLFLGVLTLYVINYVFLSFIDSTLRSNVGESTVLVAQQTVETVEKTILNRVEHIKTLAADRFYDQHLVDSNDYFAGLEDRGTYIGEQDMQWVAAPPGSSTLVMREIEENEISKSLRNVVEYFTQQNGYALFAEIFLTNRYGVNVGQTSRTTDYYQADEEWWQEAVRKGVHIATINYDESSGVDAIDIGVAIYDHEDSLLGVIKAVYDIEELTAILEGLIPEDDTRLSQRHLAHGHTSHASMNFNLLRGDSELLFSTSDDFSLASITSTEHSEQILKKKDGYFFQSKNEGAKDHLIAHAYSEDLDLTFLLEHEVTEVIGSAEDAANRYILLVMLAYTLVFLLGLFFLVKHVIQPLALFAEIAQQVAHGDLKVRIPIHRNDEIGRFGRIFNAMTNELQDSQEHLEENVEERTKELLEAQKILKEKIEELEKFQKLTVGRELKMVELKKEIHQLKRKLENGANDA